MEVSFVASFSDQNSIRRNLLSWRYNSRPSHQTQLLISSKQVHFIDLVLLPSTRPMISLAPWSNWAMMSPFNRQRVPDHDVGQRIFRGIAMASLLRVKVLQAV
jgi:hypothetical protein